jgi:membrane-bound ClpP family serine protease
MDPLLAWALGLIVLATVLFAMEVFLPSAGLLAIGSAGSAIVAVVLLYRYDTTWGNIGLSVFVVLVPASIAFFFKVWPHTPIGRRIIGAPTEEQVEQSRLQEEATKRERAAIVGKEGKVLTDLRPVGMIELDGERVEVLSETTFVPVGSTVRVISADLAQIKVRRV